MAKNVFSRGQLFTADLLVSVAVITLVLGISLHTSEALARGVFRQSEISSAAPDAIAQSLVAHGLVPSYAFHLNYSSYCVHYSNGTGNCTSLKCPSDNIIGSRRLVNCTHSSASNNCILNVRQCV